MTLEKCLSEFAAPEKVSDVHCSKCASLQTHSKRIRVYRPPRVLMINMKRFHKARGKIQSFVSFPLDLDLGEWTISSSDAQYHLYGVVNHRGHLGAGHYYAYVKTAEEKWYCFDDSRVEEIKDEGAIVSAHAYLLFYVKKGCSGGDGEDVSNSRDNDKVREILEEYVYAHDKRCAVM